MLSSSKRLGRNALGAIESHSH